MRRINLPPDTRLDWRDPDMPVLCRDRSGKVFKLTPEEARSDAAFDMMIYDTDMQGHPLNWRRDPLYNAARKRR